MRYLGPAAVLFLACASSAFAVQDQPVDKDRLILELQKKIDSLEQRVGQLEVPATAPQESGTGLESRLDEAMRKNAAEPVSEPRRLNISAPFIDGLDVTGNYRLRGEYWGNYFSGASSDDNISSIGQSVELAFNFRISEKTSVMFELHDGRNWGSPGGNTFGSVAGAPTASGTGAFGTDNTYVNQAYLKVSDIYDSGWDLQVGRQTGEYGKERLIGDDEWKNNRTSLDGFHLQNNLDESQTVRLAWYRLADGDQTVTNEFSPGGSFTPQMLADLYVGYYTNTSEDYGVIDLYLMYLDSDKNDTLGFPPTLGGRTRMLTYGVRWEREAGIFFWDAELASQIGINGQKNDLWSTRVWAVSARAGIDLKDEGVAFLKDVYAQYDYATGDNFDDRSNDLFVQLAGAQNHGWFGVQDYASWSNVIHYALGADFDVSERGTLNTSWHWLRKEAEESPIGGYRFQIGNTSGIGKALGQEFDVVYSHQCTDRAKVDVGASYFFPGDIWQTVFGDSGVFFSYLQFGIAF